LSLPMLEPKEFKPSLEKYSRAGIRLVGLTIDYPNGPATATEWLPALRRGLQATGMKPVVHAPFSDTNLMSLSPDHAAATVKAVREAMDIARKLDASIVTIHAGKTNRFTERGRWKSALKENLSSLLDYASLNGIRLSVENLFKKEGFSSEFPVTPDECEYILSKHKGLEFCMDVGHFHMSGIDVYHALEQFISRSNCIHLHDAKGRGDHLVIGSGEIDFSRIFSALIANDFKGAVIIENKNTEECLASHDFLKNKKLI
ncbi:MAG: sugar phosphate isomerase/epimerase, partial [Candidatus Aenigmarchaeota archaeon]|nr:sugar phosphate isomerase/epimerase [Candidatus Aenigmarchaeota archaeon]